MEPKKKKRLFKKSAKKGEKQQAPKKEKVIVQKKNMNTPPDSGKKVYFPNISRFITEKRVFIGLGSLIIFLILAWEVSIDISSGNMFLGVLQKRAALDAERSIWKDIATKFPNYRDAYFQVAILSYRLGDRQEQELYIKKTLELDPNFQPAKNLEKGIE